MAVGPWGWSQSRAAALAAQVSPPVLAPTGPGLHPALLEFLKLAAAFLLVQALNALWALLLAYLLFGGALSSPALPR